MEALQHSQLNVDLSLVLSSCEPELQELMRQIDLIIKQQQRDWETEMQLVRNRLKRSEDELVLCRKLMEQKELEVRSLGQRLEEQQDLAVKYEQQLQHVRAEFEKLKRGYHNLQHRQLKESRPGPSTERLDAAGRFTKPEDFGSDGRSQQLRPRSAQLGQDSTGSRHRPPLTSGSEAAVQRLLQQLDLVSSVPEENCLRLAQDHACLSQDHACLSSSTGGSRRTGSSSAAGGQKESGMVALQESCSDRSHTLCWFLQEENQRSTELLQRLDGHIHSMRGRSWRTVPAAPTRPGSARSSQLFLAQ